MNNHAAHECGLPYKIPRPHSIHGHPGLAQKSMDHLPLPGSGEGSSSQLHDSIVSAQQDVRLVRSEHGSPGPGSVPSFEELNPEVPQLDLPYSTFTNSTSAALDEYASPPSNPYETYMASTEEQPPYSACLSVPPVDWSTFDLPIDNGSLGATYSQPPSYASFEQSTLSRPGLTTTSSSETEDFVAQGLSRPGVRKGNYYTTPTSDPLGAESYRISSRPLYAAVEPTSFTTGNNLESINYDELLQGGTASPSEFEVFKNGVSVDPEAFIHHGLTVQDAQKLAHPGVPTEAMGELTLPATRDDNDPLWAAPYSEDETSADGIDDDPEKVWRS
ncbi:hypothetical protein MMC13_006478 [Lambiella insularis]|nr:hypothetical protein [Lambiella insularis]